MSLTVFSRGERRNVYVAKDRRTELPQIELLPWSGRLAAVAGGANPPLNSSLAWSEPVRNVSFADFGSEAQGYARKQRRNTARARARMTLPFRESIGQILEKDVDLAHGPAGEWLRFRRQTFETCQLILLKQRGWFRQRMMQVVSEPNHVV